VDIDDEEAMAGFQSSNKRRWEATKACIQVIVFFTFLILYSCVVMLECDIYERYLQETVTDHFKKPFASKFAPSEVNSQEKLWEYIDNGLIGALFGNGTSQYGETKLEHGLPTLGGDQFASNRVLGAARIRQLKVVPGDRASGGCGERGAYYEFFAKCYPQYSPRVEKIDTYGSTSETFEWIPSVVDSVMPGRFAFYGTGGYLETLSANMTYTRERMQILKDSEWLDVSTRVLMFDFNIWNPNLELYAITRVMFEISPIGDWFHNVRVLILKPRYLSAFGNNSGAEWMMTIFECLIALFCLYYIADEISEFWVNMGEYVQDGWNMIDWATLVLLLVAFVMRIQNYTSAGALVPGLNEKDDPMAYTDLQKFAERIYDTRKINSFNSVLIWVKIVKYVPMMPYARVMKELFASSGSMFLCFVALFVIFFIGFGLAFCVGFGMDVQELSSWPVSWVYLGRSLLGDVDVTEIYRYAPYAGSLMLMLFVVGMYMVLLNLWYALILFSFSQTREVILEKKESKDEKPLLEVFIGELKNAILANLDIERMVRKYTPGLHARTMEKWRRAEAKVGRRRDRRLALEHERTRNQQLDRAKSGWSLMPFNRTLEGGSTLNRPGSLLGIGDIEDTTVHVGAEGNKDEAASEVTDEDLDLGPMSPTNVHAKKKWQRRMGLDEEIKPSVDDLESAIQSLGTQILDRVRHIGKEVKDEMEETKEVLAGIKDVIQVVNRRVKDLDVVQKQSL